MTKSRDWIDRVGAKRLPALIREYDLEVLNRRLCAALYELDHRTLNLAHGQLDACLALIPWGIRRLFIQNLAGSLTSAA